MQTAAEETLRGVRRGVMLRARQTVVSVTHRMVRTTQ